MLLPVLIVSSLVHIYSIGYMSHDPRGCVRENASMGVNCQIPGNS
jgi:NADH:ubiquinone oxidoreductase subunit 5 (subunit L)/multisubunit Na+/H+ antiporter MnhA subunit